MSSTSRQFFKSDDLAMIGRVLDRANFHKSTDPIKSEARLHAARFLIASFQQGATDELELRSRLAGRAPDESEPVVPPAFDIANQASNSNSARDGRVSHSHQFGKRIETNGSWTIYHVFTGVPAALGNWEMVQLDVKTAIRALKILNSGQPEAEPPEAEELVADPDEQHVQASHVSMADRARAFDKYD